jgi:hypothetical protein
MKVSWENYSQYGKITNVPNHQPVLSHSQTSSDPQSLLVLASDGSVLTVFRSNSKIHYEPLLTTINHY